MRRLGAILLTCLLLALPVRALDVEGELASLTGADALEDGLNEAQRALLAGAETDSPKGFFSAVQQLLRRALLHGGGYAREAAGSCALLLAVCLACGLCGSLEQSPPVQTVRIGGTLAAAAISAGSVTSLLRLGAETVQDLSAYGALLLPVLSASAAAAGAVTGGSVLGALTVLLTDVLMGLVSKCLLPLLGAFLAMSLADCLLGNQMLRRVRDLLAWAVRTGLKAALYGFTGFLAVTQVITGAADAAVNKAAKLTLSGAVPVVGSILSDASETLLASAAVLRSSVGVFGMLAVLALCLLPFLRIGVHYLALRVTAAAAGAVAQEAVVSMIDAAAEAMGLLLAMTGACALLLLISAACAMKAVGA